MTDLKIGDRVENIFAAEDGEEDCYRYGTVYDIYLDREGEEMVEVEYPGYYYASIREEYLRPDPREGKSMSGKYDMPEGRTWCGILRCCREQDHKGSCEVDITELMPEELDAIRRSAT